MKIYKVAHQDPCQEVSRYPSRIGSRISNMFHKIFFEFVQYLATRNLQTFTEEIGKKIYGKVMIRSTSCQRVVHILPIFSSFSQSIKIAELLQKLQNRIRESTISEIRSAPESINPRQKKSNCH